MTEPNRDCSACATGAGEHQVMLYDRNGEPIGECLITTRCWCNHTLGQHYASHCVPDCPCGGDYPPRLPAGKQGFSQAQHQPPATCFRCDTELELTLPGSTQNALCDACKRRLQQKVDEAVRGIEFEMVNGVFQRKKRSWSRYLPKQSEVACFFLGVFLARVIAHALGWWFVKEQFVVWEICNTVLWLVHAVVLRFTPPRPVPWIWIIIGWLLMIASEVPLLRGAPENTWLWHASVLLFWMLAFFYGSGTGKRLWGKIKSAALTAVNQASFRNQQKEAFS